MSRIGKKPIQIPAGVEVKIEGRVVKVTGPLGENQVEFLPDVAVEKQNDLLLVQIRENLKNSPAVCGLTRALLQNAVSGVVSGFEKKLEIRGVGYKASVEGASKIKLDVGFSHSVFVAIPEGLKVKVEKEIITISGFDKQKVGQLAAKIRQVRPPEPYKGKGIRYFGEVVRKKEGKKAATTTG